LNLPYDLQRKLELLKRQIDLPPPDDPAKSAELAKITTELDSMYGAGKYCKDGTCRDLEESWLGEFGQGDRWRFCLTAAGMARAQERR
jgi:hypothetical protein